MQIAQTRRGAYAAASYIVASLVESGAIAPMNFDEQCGAIDCVRDEFLDILSTMDAVPAYVWPSDNPVRIACDLHKKHAGPGCQLSGLLPVARVADALYTACCYTFKFTD